MLIVSVVVLVTLLLMVVGVCLGRLGHVLHLRVGDAGQFVGAHNNFILNSWWQMQFLLDRPTPGRTRDFSSIRFCFNNGGVSR